MQRPESCSRTYPPISPVTNTSPTPPHLCRYSRQIPLTTLFSFQPTISAAASWTAVDLRCCPQGFTPRIGFAYCSAPSISFWIHLLRVVYIPAGITTTWQGEICL